MSMPNLNSQNYNPSVTLINIHFQRFLYENFLKTLKDNELTFQLQCKCHNIHDIIPLTSNVYSSVILLSKLVMEVSIKIM